jgi:hypothetical protein
VFACRAIRAQQIQPGAQRQNSPFCTGQPAFNLILSMREIPPNNPTSVEVRQYIEGSPGGRRRPRADRRNR